MEDFETALYLTDHSLDSALEMYELLPDINSPKSTKNKDFFYSLIPAEFDRAKAVQIAENSKIKPRSTDRYLNFYLENKLLCRPTNGDYVKV